MFRPGDFRQAPFSAVLFILIHAFIHFGEDLIQIVQRPGIDAATQGHAQVVPFKIISILSQQLLQYLF